MKTETYQLELITPCFCGGADPKKRAELRVPSIRGQLRWWLRTLGGFQALHQKGMSVREQEEYVFGNAAGDRGRASRLSLRLNWIVDSTRQVNAEDLNAGVGSPLGYALFPLRPTQDDDARRGMIEANRAFSLQLIWRGGSENWPAIRALAAVWANLGGLGFRQRRGWGAVRLLQPQVVLSEELAHFANPGSIVIREIAGQYADWQQAAEKLLNWYRSWRHHGQMNRRWNRQAQRWVPVPDEQKQENRGKCGFRWARRDHNEGLDVQGTGAPNPDREAPYGQRGETFRPALGLPIVQYFSSLGGEDGPLRGKAATVFWGPEPGGQGRFASPVLLRPYQDTGGRWHALVIFVEAHKWPVERPVYLSHQRRVNNQVQLHSETRRVRLDLYEKMKQDPKLSDFR